VPCVRLDDFNAAGPVEAAAQVRVWADVPSWVEAVVEGRPYPDAAAVRSRAAALAQRWDEADLDAALAHHPRIGERPSGSGAAAEASRGEQASMAHADDDDAAAIAAGNAAYEARFGRVFLVRAAGRSPAQLRAELERRLGNDPADEVREAAGQLAEIALLRLESDLEPDLAADLEPDRAADRSEERA